MPSRCRTFTRWTEAESEFRRSLELNPNNAPAHYFYAFGFLANQNRQTEAIDQMRTALSLDPLSSIVNTNYAVLLMEAHRYPESLAQFQKVLERDSGFAPAHYKLSQLYATTGRFADAVNELQGAFPKPIPVSSDAKGYLQLILRLHGTDARPLQPSPRRFSETATRRFSTWRKPTQMETTNS